MTEQTKPRFVRVFVGDATTAPPQRADTESWAGAAVTVTDAIDTFLAAVDDRSVRDRRGQPYDRTTARDLRWCLAGHVREALGAMRVDVVRRGDVAALLAELADEGVPERRCRAVGRAVRALYDDAVARGLADQNPASGVAVAEDRTVPPAGSAPWLGRSERAISLVLRGATVGFLLLALVFLTESL